MVNPKSYVELNVNKPIFIIIKIFIKTYLIKT